MRVVDLGALKTASIIWRPTASSWAQTIVCKATFVLEPDVASLASEQEYPHEEANHWDDDPARSLVSLSELEPFKARADVLLVGSAFAPGGEPARCVVARMVVGAVDKSIDVHCDRAWSQEGLLQELGRFVKMPLRYERAAARADTNPVGIWLGAPPDASGMTVVPNLQPHGFSLTKPADRFDPVGFGPVSPEWPARAAKLGPSGARWERDKPRPPRFDASYFNGAPADQQTDWIRDDERIVLENLHPLHPTLVTRLPGLHPRVFKRLPGAVPTEVAMVADTLYIDTDRAICTLVWRGKIPLSRPDRPGEVLVLLEDSKRSLTTADMERLGLREPAAPDEDEGTNKMVFSAPAGSALIGVASSTPARPRLESSESTGTIILQTVTGAPVRAPQATLNLEHPVPTVPSRVGLDFAPPWLARPTPQPFSLALPTPGSPDLSTSHPPLPLDSSGPASTPSPTTAPVSAPAPEAAPAVAPTAIGAVAASNAAADAARAGEAAQQRTPSPLPPGDVVELLWFDPKAMARIRLWWKPFIEELAFAPFDARHDLPSEDAQRASDRHDTFGIMTQVEADAAAGMARALQESVTSTGRFTAPMVLVRGDLRFFFDELETLKSIVGALSPVAGTDKKLRALLAQVSELLATPYLEGSTDLIVKLTQQLRDQVVESRRELPADYLSKFTERRLLDGRHYQKRRVFGGVWIRCLLDLADADYPVPTYLPESLVDELPMLTTMRVRLIAELCPQQDQHEKHAYALRVVALGRVLTIGRTWQDMVKPRSGA